MRIGRQTLFSPCRAYRYVLWREWSGTSTAYALFIGLNPSTADEVQDDPTIRRCSDYARRWGYGALCMVNLFAYRATNPRVLRAQALPVGVENDRWIRRMAKDAAIVIAAWGVEGTHRGRDRAVTRLLGAKLFCLKITRDGHPGHPLYLKKTLMPFPYRPAAQG